METSSTTYTTNQASKAEEEKDEQRAEKELAEQNNALKAAHVERVRHEAYMQMKAKGPGVVTLISAKIDNIPPQLLMEFMCHMSVYDELQSAARDNSESIFHPQNPRNLHEHTSNGVEVPVFLQCVRIAKDVAATLARLHSLGILHLDLAARNLFLDAAKRPKLGDFGLSAFESDMLSIHDYCERKLADYGGSAKFKERYLEEIENDARDDFDLPLKHRLHSSARPDPRMPEKSVRSQKNRNPLFDKSSDIYAFGCFMYCCASEQCGVGANHNERDYVWLPNAPC